MRIGKIVSGAEYGIDEHFQNLPILEAKFWFSKLKKLKCVNFPTWKMLRISQIV